jgi:hypothetical protein
MRACAQSNTPWKIMPDVTLDEVRTILAHTAGPSLSDIIQEQRGAKP